MVWARTKMAIWDYILDPVKEVRISYSGNHPEKLYKKLNELMRTVFNVPEGYVQEKKFKWDKGEKGEKFEIDWELNKLFDEFSFILFRIKLKGYTSDGKGKASIKLSPVFVTEYPQDTVWQQNIIYEIFRRFWHTVFYNKKRLEYLDIAKDLTVAFEGSIKKYIEEIR